jgi:hypothetical protein
MIAKLLMLHFVADFLLQPREMGQKKSSEFKWLAGHLAIQFAIFAPFTSISFAAMNCVFHGVIDWFIWRGYKALVYKRIHTDDQGFKSHSLLSNEGEWRFWLDKVFYDTIGFDQLLHGLTLVFLATYMAWSL